MSKVESMRRDWDDRARKDPFFYIASWKSDWKLPEFFQSGEDDYGRLVAPILEREGFYPAGRSMLELGCGVGRMTKAFAARFAEVRAFDVSEEMLSRAKELSVSATNISWVQANGKDLSCVPDESVDFVFSYLVLQHMPKKPLVFGIVQEMIRVVKPGGFCLFQFTGRSPATMNLRGRMLWGWIDSLWTIGLRRFARETARIAGLDPNMAGKTWHGSAIDAATMAEVVAKCGCERIEIRDGGTPLAWCCARKARVTQKAAGA